MVGLLHEQRIKRNTLSPKPKPVPKSETPYPIYGNNESLVLSMVG